MTTINARFHDTTASRTTDAPYTHASRRAGSSVVRFHTSREAARRAAGRYGEVVPTDFAPVAAVSATTSTWRVRFADGSTMDVATDVPPEAISAARAAHPDRVVTGASRVH
jgi:hypothetical protein